MDSGVDDLLELMDAAGIPRTREDYIAVAWGDDPPVPWTAELESELPEDLQDWSLFDVVDGRLQKKGVGSVYLDHWMRREFNPDEPRDEDGKWTDGGGSDGGGGDSSGGGVEFVSPSVESNLDLKQAVSALGGAQQASLRQASDYIDQELKLAGKAANAVGAWSDGAENTVVDFHGSSKWTDWDRIALAASMKGHIADQKSVLAFQEQQNRQPRESRSIALSSKTKLTVEINPTTRDIRSMAKEAPVRVLIDSDGNMYAWDANEAIHSQVAGVMGLDEKHEDTWQMWRGKLVSYRYLFDPNGGKTDQQREKDAATEVRDTMASLNGNAILLSFPAKGDLAAIHQSLLSDGLPFHTLIPGKGGATVYVAATDPKEMTATVDAAKKAAERYDSQITVRRGRGEFIGDFSGSGSDREQRDRARQAYEQVIQRSSVHDSEAVWQRVRDKWGQAAAKAYPLAREFNPDEPRDEDGKWTDGGGSDGGGESDSSGVGGSARPPAPAGEIQNNKIPHNLTTDEKVAHLVALTAENKPILDAAIAKIDAKYGTESSSDIKKPDRIAAKASRPSVLAAKPWFDVEYIRDSLRFKSVVDTFANTKAIVKELEDSGDFKVIKYDVGKVTNPKEWGWRMLPIDLQMKNGQIVEYYMVSKDQAAVAHEGHTIFEKWRNLDAAKFTPAQVKEYQADLAASQKLNGDAWQAYKDRTGQTESDFLASVTRDSTSSKSSIK